MAFITGIPIRNSIHTEESTSVADWGKYRSELTGLYITGEGTGAMYEQYAAQDFREYNKKIHDLGLNEFNSDLYLRPFVAPWGPRPCPGRSIHILSWCLDPQILKINDLPHNQLS